MALQISTTIFISLVVLAFYLLNRVFRSSKHALPLPPGPKGLPLLGNTDGLPKPGGTEWQHWLTHKDLYGPISSITVLGQPFIIINSAEIALELLRDRANTNSGRPGMVFSGKMVGWDRTVGMQQPGAEFKQHRKNIAKVASSAGVLSVFDRVQEEESAHFLINLLKSPDDLFDHIRVEAGTVVARIIYDYVPEAHGNDPLIDLVGQCA